MTMHGSHKPAGRQLRSALLAGILLLIFDSGCGLNDKAARKQCRDGCDDINFFNCVEADVVKACNDQCAVQPIPLVEDFADCTDGAGGCSSANCLSIIGVQAGTAPSSDFDVSRCKDACNDVKSCSTREQTSDCLSRCETESSQSINAFASCVNIIDSCEENTQCYTTLGL